MLWQAITTARRRSAYCFGLLEIYSNAWAYHRDMGVLWEVVATPLQALHVSGVAVSSKQSSS